MRLSDIKDERALDVLADIIEPAADILSDEEVKTMYRSGQPMLRLAAYIIRNHKKSIIEIMACLDGEDPKDYSFNLVTLPQRILELINDPGLNSLFTSRVQNNE